MKFAPFTSACAGVANQPIILTEEPAVRFHDVVRLTGVKLLTLEPSVMLASVAVDAFGVTVSVAFFVAVNATVATFDVKPICATAVLGNISTAAAVMAFLRRRRIAELQAKVVLCMHLRSTRGVPELPVNEQHKNLTVCAW